MRLGRHRGVCACVASLALPAFAACGGPRVDAVAPQTPGATAQLQVRVRLATSAPGASLAVRASASGAPQSTGFASETDIRSAACAIIAAERICSIAMRAPVGTDDVDVRVRDAAGADVLQGAALRASVPPIGTSVSVAFDGRPARWAISPALIAAPADGLSHDVPFAVQAEDADGYTLLVQRVPPPRAVDVSGDVQRVLTIAAQGAGPPATCGSRRAHRARPPRVPRSHRSRSAPARSRSPTVRASRSARRWRITMARFRRVPRVPIAACRRRRQCPARAAGR
jgi:hypothetical protein